MRTQSLRLNIRTHREELVADETGTHQIIFTKLEVINYVYETRAHQIMFMRREHIRSYL